MDRLGVLGGEAAGIADACDADEVSDQPVRHVARLHRRLVLLHRHRDVGDLAAEHLREHLGERAVVGGRAGENIGLAGMRRRIGEDARGERAGVAHVDQRQREIRRVGHDELAVALDRSRLAKRRSA